jgi:hypothetical protein
MERMSIEFVVNFCGKKGSSCDFIYRAEWPEWVGLTRSLQRARMAAFRRSTDSDLRSSGWQIDEFTT